MKVRRPSGGFTRQWVITGASLACASLIIVLFAVISAPPAVRMQVQPSRSQTYPWVSSGTYAYYSGSSVLPGGTAYNMTYLWKVLAVNGTRAQVLTVMNLTAHSGAPSSYRNVNWMSIDESAIPSFFLLTDEAAFLSYQTTVTMTGKAIPVVAYVYDQSASGDSETVVFMKEDIGPPVQFTFSSEGLGSITDALVKTNIPGLLP